MSNQGKIIKRGIVIAGSCLFVLVLPILIFSYSKPKIAEIDPIFVADFSNDRILVGSSQNIFVGKVIAQTGNKERGIGPETQYSVQVIYDIKGDLSGAISLDQQGGYENGVLYEVEDDAVLQSQDSNSYLLQPGSTYLLATRYSSSENWYTLIPYPTARKLLSTNATLTNAQLKNLATTDSRVQQLEAAYPHEILLAADVAQHNTLNSYASLSQPHPPNPTTPIEDDQMTSTTSVSDQDDAPMANSSVSEDATSSTVSTSTDTTPSLMQSSASATTSTPTSTSTDE